MRLPEKSKGTAAAGKKAKRQEDSADLCSFCFSDRRSGCGCQQDAMGQFPAADEWEEQGDLWFCGIRWKKAVCRTTRKRGKRS